MLIFSNLTTHRQYLVYLVGYVDVCVVVVVVIVIIVIIVIIIVDDIDSHVDDRHHECYEPNGRQGIPTKGLSPSFNNFVRFGTGHCRLMTVE